MKSHELLHRLLFLALLEIRVEAYETKNARIFHLSDLFHNMPLQLNKVIEEDFDYDEILAQLYKRADEKGLTGWLNHSIENNI